MATFIEGKSVPLVMDYHSYLKKKYKGIKNNQQILHCVLNNSGYINVYRHIKV